MILLENEKKLNEMNVTFDKLRRIGSLTGWQRRIYNFIIDRLGATYLEKVANFINDKSENVVPEGTDPELVKDIIKLALIDYVDSSM